MEKGKKKIEITLSERFPEEMHIADLVELSVLRKGLAGFEEWHRVKAMPVHLMSRDAQVIIWGLMQQVLMHRGG